MLFSEQHREGLLGVSRTSVFLGESVAGTGCWAWACRLQALPPPVVGRGRGWGGAPSTSSAVLCPAPGNRPPLSGPLTPGLVAGAVLADLCPHCPVCHPSFSLPISVLLLPRWLISWVDPGADMLLGRTQASATPHVTPCPHRPSTRTHGLLATLHTGPRAFAHAARLSGDPTAGPSPDSSASGHPEPP